MSPLQITRRRSSTDPKQKLRTYVESLPIDQQQAFVTIARQIMHRRSYASVSGETSVIDGLGTKKVQ